VHPFEPDAERWLRPAPEEPAREIVGELAVGVVFLYQLYKRREAVLMQACQVLLVEGFAELAEVRSRPDLLYQVFGGRVVLRETLRVVTYEIYPRAATTPPGADQGALSFRCESYLEERVRQTQMVHLLVEPNKASQVFEGVLERDRELQLLVQVVERPVEGLVALQDQIRPGFDPLDEGRHLAQQSGVGDEVSDPGGTESVDGTPHELPEIP
jgi:hypothetical protein